MGYPRLGDLDEAIRLDPRLAMAYLNRGALYNDLGQPDYNDLGLSNARRTNGDPSSIDGIRSIRCLFYFHLLNSLKVNC